MKRDPPHRVGGKDRNPSPPREEKDAPQSTGMKCRNPSLRPNEMSELLTAPEWNGMLLIASEGSAATSHCLGRKGDAPQSIGMKCQNP
jgi:hypothetical protein